LTAAQPNLSHDPHSHYAHAFSGDEADDPPRQSGHGCGVDFLRLAQLEANELGLVEATAALADLVGGARCARNHRWLRWSDAIEEKQT